MATKARSQSKPEKVAASLFRPPNRMRFNIWIVGETPLITHAWSEKARREMLGKQVKAVQVAKEPRDPENDYVNSRYEIGDGTYGFPAMAFKNAIISAAHVDKGVPKTAVLAALWIDATMVRTRPALAGAICDMPLLRIYGGESEMREDPVRIGVGLHKTATLAYRAQFNPWAVRLTGRLNIDIVPIEALGFLINEAGFACGVGEWRNEKKGMFGAFRCATAAEHKTWDAIAAGEGASPAPVAEAA